MSSLRIDTVQYSTDTMTLQTCHHDLVTLRTYTRATD